MADTDLDALAAAVVDRESVDWHGAHARLDSARHRALATSLWTLSRLTTTRTASVPPTDRRLPWLLEIAHAISIPAVLCSLPGFVLLLRGTRPVRFGVLLATMLTFAATGAYLDAAARDRRARAIATFLWMSAASYSARGIFELTQRWPAVGLFGFMLAMRPEAFFAAGLWQFARDFPSATRFGVLDRVCLLGLRVALAVGAALFTVNLLPYFDGASDLSALLSPFQRLAGDGVIFWDLVFGTSVPALLVMAGRARRASGTERNRVRIFLLSITLAFTPIVAQVLLEGMFPGYMRLMRTPSGMVWSGLFVYPPVLLLPLATAYTVASPNVLQVRVVLHRALRRLLAWWLVSLAAAIPLVALVAHLFRHADETMSVALAIPPARTLMWLSAAGVTVLMARKFLVRTLDRAALSGAQDGSTMLARLTERFKDARTPLEVAAALGQAINQSLQAPTRTYLCVDSAFVAVDGGSEPDGGDSLIRVLLQGAAEPCFVSAGHPQSYYALITNSDRQWIERSQVEILVPVLSGRKGDGLFAIIALQRRTNALTFTQSDVRLLRAGAASASLACDALAVGNADVTQTAPLDELAMQCGRCGRVEPWQSKTPACPCGGTQQTSALPKLLLQRYEVRRRLGAGGMGVVYEATDTVLGRAVALKTLPRLSQESADRLMTEARTMAALSHTSLAVLFGAERWRGTPVLVMEYLVSGTLADRLRRSRLSPSAAVQLVRQLTAALEYVHNAGLYHGDIKPSNVGLTADDSPKFLDFGLSRALTETADGIGADDNGGPAPLGGTPAYLSPEVRAGEPVTAAMDLWALGLLFCESLLGKHPALTASSPRELQRDLGKAMNELSTFIAPELCAIIAALLTTDPRQRLSTASELRRALDALSPTTLSHGTNSLLP